MKNARWVDVAKCLAIFAVMTDHMRGGVYDSDAVQELSFFSVTLFIIIMGVTSFWSFDHSKDVLWKKVIKRLVHILPPYCAAVFVYHCVSNKGFNWIDYKNNLIFFNATDPHYYVLLYIMLVIISPIIYRLIKYMEIKFSDKFLIAGFVFGLGLLLIGRICNIYTNFADIYGVRLFGGSYLLCLYIGMLFGKYCNLFISFKSENKIWYFFSSLALMISVMYLISVKGFVFDYKEPVGSVINPPGITLIIYAFLVMIFIFLIDNMIIGLDIPLLNRFLSCMTYIGRNTLFIFLYHMLFLRFLVNHFGWISFYIKVPLFYAILICGSLLMGKFYELLKDSIIDCYMYSKYR